MILIMIFIQKFNITENFSQKLSQRILKQDRPRYRFN